MIILFKNNIGEKLCEEWYKNRYQKEEDERIRIVEMAAQIIVEDIRRKHYDLNNYKIPNYREDNLFEDVPMTLKKFKI